MRLAPGADDAAYASGDRPAAEARGEGLVRAAAGASLPRAGLAGAEVRDRRRPHPLGLLHAGRMRGQRRPRSGSPGAWRWPRPRSPTTSPPTSAPTCSHPNHGPPSGPRCAGWSATNARTAPGCGRTARELHAVRAALRHGGSGPPCAGSQRRRGRRRGLVGDRLLRRRGGFGRVEQVADRVRSARAGGGAAAGDRLGLDVRQDRGHEAAPDLGRRARRR